ncbi:hypothetical protein MVEN_02363300 [Mycena venus]|uniref:Uncharacterized protein n=1 Tax=Mycena venus TaxID=2733690 RepID=A0A8H6X3F2_9AGAR|nr:hypothetical protein MVEN_02363300 [Mycena venus]
MQLACTPVVMASTPSASATIPSSLNCITMSTIMNSIALASLRITGSAVMVSASRSNKASGASPAHSGAAFHGVRVGTGSGGEFTGIGLVSLAAGLAAISLLH